LKNLKTLCIALAAAFSLVGNVAYAQVYSWKDPDTGHSRFSNIPPPWYSRGEIVSGPRVIETLGGKVVDDTALPYEDRLLLSGKSKDYIENLRLQKATASRTRQDPVRKSANSGAEAPNRQSANTAPKGPDAGRNKGS